MAGDKGDNEEQRVKGALITPPSCKEKYGLTVVRTAPADVQTLQSFFSDHFSRMIYNKDIPELKL